MQKEVSNTKKRIVWIDLLKGIAILWLIVYHMHVFGWLRDPVPVFFFLSGLFFSEGKSFGDFISKKAKALFIPFFFFLALGLISSAIGALVTHEPWSFPQIWKLATLIPKEAEEFSVIGVGGIWFFISLFEMYVIYYGLRRVSKNWIWLLSASIVIMILSVIARNYYDKDSLFFIFHTGRFFVYFVIANLLREKILYSKIPLWLFIVAVLAYSVRFIHWSGILTINPIGMSIVLWVNRVTSFMGLIVILIWIGERLTSIEAFCKSKLCGFFIFEGINSGTILGTHMLAMGVVGILLKHFMPVGALYYVFQFVLIVIVCNICIALFNRYVPFLVNHKKS